MFIEKLQTLAASLAGDDDSIAISLDVGLIRGKGGESGKWAK